jgi:Xaa-Pro aminopeptidase
MRLLDRLGNKLDGPYLLLNDPIHLSYLTNFWVDPFSLGAGFGGYLLIRPDGHATLFHDNRLPDSAARAHVDKCRVIDWYDAQKPANGPRRLALVNALRDAASSLFFSGNSFRVHDQPNDPLGPTLIHSLSELRRQKDPDELALLWRCMHATDVGHAWGRGNIKPGMTELDVYLGVSNACTKAVGEAVVVYGDFAVSPGPERKGGPPTDHVLQIGEMFILDYSVVIHGYRSDFTNTLVVGRKPTAEQQRLCDLCKEAMAAGEKTLKAGVACLEAYQAVRRVFDKAGMGEYFPHHAGHGLGLTHPEAPYIVQHATEHLLAGDVITLEPGLYVPGIGGIRIENNYLITEQGYDRLSNHVIDLN